MSSGFDLKTVFQLAIRSTNLNEWVILQYSCLLWLRFKYSPPYHLYQTAKLYKKNRTIFTHRQNTSVDLRVLVGVSGRGAELVFKALIYRSKVPGTTQYPA